MSADVQPERAKARNVDRRILWTLAIILVLALLVSPSVHVVRYAGRFDIVPKAHFSAAMTMVPLREVVQRANAIDLSDEANLRHLVRELELAGLIRQRGTRADDLAGFGVLSDVERRVANAVTRPTFECVVSDWCR